MDTTSQALPVPRHEPRITSIGQWRALSWRGMNSIFKNGEFIFAIVSPLFLALCFYLPLRSIMEARGIDYAQFLMPIIILQSIGFTASAAAMRASLDGDKGVNTRFRVLPMNGAIPALARLTTNIVLLMLSIVFASLICLGIGWRPGGGVIGVIGLFAVALAVGIIVSLLCDGIGMLSSSPEATSQAMALPILILGMCSTGFVTEEQFPEWIRPFVRNQPVSQVAQAMRAFNDGHVTWYDVGPTVWWCCGLLIVALILVVAGSRKVPK